MLSDINYRASHSPPLSNECVLKISCTIRYLQLYNCAAFITVFGENCMVFVRNYSKLANGILPVGVWQNVVVQFINAITVDRANRLSVINLGKVATIRHAVEKVFSSVAKVQAALSAHGE